MDDSVPEGEPMLLPLHLMPEGGGVENKSGFHSDQKTQRKRQEEGEGGGGLIRNLMSTMASPLGMKAGEAETEDDTRDEIPKKEGEEEGGRGILNNIISNLFHQNDDEQGKKIEDDDDEEKNKQVKAEEQSNGGVLKNIVSHLPPSIPDDAAPTADEATILINSLVRD